MAMKKEKEYLYKPKDPSGNDYAALSGMSDVHRAALDAAGKGYNEATTDEERADWHQKAENIRKLYDYSGGGDGSEYKPLSTTPDLSFSGGNRPTYSGKYTQQIDALLDEILNGEAFSYDPATDPTFQQYEESYTRQGKKAMEDVLAQVSARTGGLSSSYATTAAQQTYDGYMEELAGMIPELKQLAYEMYLSDRDRKVQNLGLLQGMEDTEYGRFRDLMGDWENDRNFGYSVYRDDITDQQYADEFAYQKERDAVEDERYEREWAYQLAQDQLKASSSGSGSGGSGGKSKPTLTAAQTLSALEKGVINETTKAAYEYYFGEPYDDASEEDTPDESSGVDLSDVKPGVLSDIRSRLMELGPSSSDDATRARELLKILNSMASSGLINEDQADRIAAFYGF